MKAVGSYWMDEDGAVYRILKINDIGNALDVYIEYPEDVLWPQGSQRKFWSFLRHLTKHTPSTESAFLLEGIH